MLLTRDVQHLTLKDPFGSVFTEHNPTRAIKLHQKCRFNSVILVNF